MQNESHSEYASGDWRDIYRGHACYTPGKDLVIPAFKWPVHYERWARAVARRWEFWGGRVRKAGLVPAGTGTVGFGA